MITKEKKELISVYKQGLELYKKREWSNATEKFKLALEIDEEDGPSKLYLDRCKYFEKKPPPDDWDGVFTMTTK